MKTGDEDTISSTIRKYVREDQSFMPQYATTSTQLSLVCLKTSWLSTQCRFHHKIRGDTPSDGFDGLIHGTAYPKDLGTKGQPVEPPGLHLNCGCSAAHAVLDLFLWKTTTIQSTKPQHWLGAQALAHDVIRGRVRSFMIEIFSQYGNLSIDDLFDIATTSQSEDQATVQTLGRQAANILGKLAARGFGVAVSPPVEGEPQSLRISHRASQ